MPFTFSGLNDTDRGSADHQGAEMSADGDHYWVFLFEKFYHSFYVAEVIHVPFSNENEMFTR